MSRHNPPKTPKSVPLPPASPEEQERWKAAARMEAVSLTEFQRRALNERAQNVIHPGSRMLGGIVESVSRLMTGKPVIVNPLVTERMCACGHPETRHVQYGGYELRGSCGSALCNCAKYSPVQGRSLLPKA